MIHKLIYKPTVNRLTPFIRWFELKFKTHKHTQFYSLVNSDKVRWSN
jgi:hypothetical protein